MSIRTAGFRWLPVQPFMSRGWSFIFFGVFEQNIIIAITNTSQASTGTWMSILVKVGISHPVGESEASRAIKL